MNESTSIEGEIIQQENVTFLLEEESSNLTCAWSYKSLNDPQPFFLAVGSVTFLANLLMAGIILAKPELRQQVCLPPFLINKKKPKCF